MFKIVSASPSGSTGSKEGEAMDTEEKASSNVSDTYAQQVRCIIDAISSLSRLAPQVFMHGLFKKLMHRLLEEIQSGNGDSERICSLLSLTQALVASEVLDDASISFLYRAIKPLIRNDEHGPRVQKRAYKLLAEICERHHSFVAEVGQLKELTDLLTGTIMTSQIAARHMRLKCMNIIVDGFNETNSDNLVRIRVRSAAYSVCIPPTLTTFFSVKE
jgi:ribosomal RNA-processing protein 12